MKSICLAIVFSLTLLTLRAKAQKGEFKFNELTLNLKPYGKGSPEISLNIYGDKRIELVRTLYTAKGHVDNSASGTFKGILPYKDYDRLIGLLKDCNLDMLSFPEPPCCNGPVKILIVSYNKAYKRFEFITSRDNMKKCIAFLTQLAVAVKIPAYKGAIDFEE